MCGIFGYIGDKESLPFLLEGLRKLEYRGYDSAGVATLDRGRLFVSKRVGKISELEGLLQSKPQNGQIGIAHTRWATHGRPSDHNSHPHTDCKHRLSVVHNGIIENYLELRRQLSEEGHKFTSTTDTEVLAHLIEKHFKGDLEEAVRKTIQEVVGSYAIAAISQDDPDKIVVARKASPLILGFGEKENFVASDIPAMLKYTGKIIYLMDGEIAVIRKDSVKITDLDNNPVTRETTLISWDPESAEKGGYAHFMLKEIHEQPKAVRDTIASRVDAKNGLVHFDELNISAAEIKNFNRIVITACGTSWHSALVGEYMFEKIARFPVEVEYAAEFRYRDPIIDEKTLVIAISQSGETADTLGALWEAKARGAKVITICNVVGSTMARDSHGVVYTQAGPEIGVASTKAFTTQLTILYLLALHFAKDRNVISDKEYSNYLEQLMEVPNKIENLLTSEKAIERIAEKYYEAANALYLGRGQGFPIALEGALKLKEISYIHAEGYPAAEMKHGPIALIDQQMPVVVLALKGSRYDKILGNIEEVKARGGKVIAIATEGDTEIAERVDDVIYVPQISGILSPILAVVPLQLFAYFIALKRGCHVDQPRNLAKSVTVE
jgi:glucosamine--fructose-6-phosphate aminotransferase (isomerizing)